MKNKIIKTIAPYGIALILTYLFLVIIAGINLIDIDVPIDFHWDSILGFIGFKAFFQNEFGLFDVIRNSSFSAPIGLNLGGFPSGDINLMLILMKFISIFHKNYIGVVNIYFFLTFFLTTFTSLFVLRKIKIPNSIAIVLSILYSFLPYHFLRGIRHLGLASYFLIPLMVLVFLYLWKKKPLFFKYKNSEWDFDFFNKKALFVYLVILLSSVSAIYYTVFFMFFVLIVGVSAWIYRKNICHLYSALFIIILTCFFVVISFLPNIFYSIQNPDIQYTKRGFAETEYYGLRVSNMIMPIDNHRIKILSNLKNNFNTGSLYINESNFASLGLLFSSAFIFTIVNFLFLRKNKFTIYDKLGILTICSLLLTVSGGFLTFFAYFGINQIRSCNRISIFIAFFVLISLAFLLKNLKSKMLLSKFNLFLILIFSLALFDQTSVFYNYYPRQKLIKSEITSTKILMSKIENIVGNNTMIFQLPFLDFPEGSPRYYMSDYDLAKPLIATDKLKFSYGAIKGTELSNKYEYISNLPEKEMILNLKNLGFAGILIDRKGYYPYPKDFSEFTKLLGKPIVSPDNNLVFYKL